MILQLNPPLPVITPYGEAIAHLVIDYGPEENLMWVCFQKNGEIWTFPNPEVRAQENRTFDRKPQDIRDFENTEKTVTLNRKAQLDLVINVFKECVGPLTINEITDKTKLPRATVANLIAINFELFKKAELPPGTQRGMKPYTYTLKQHDQTIAGNDQTANGN